MKSVDNRKEKSKKFGKIIVNVPQPLLDMFDEIRSLQSYSRSEAIKEAMRQFTIDNTPEEYIPKQHRAIYKQSMSDTFEGMGEGLARMATNPKYQQLQQQNAPQPLPLTSQITSITESSTEQDSFKIPQRKSKRSKRQKNTE